MRGGALQLAAASRARHRVTRALVERSGIRHLNVTNEFIFLTREDVVPQLDTAQFFPARRLLGRHARSAPPPASRVTRCLAAALCRALSESESRSRQQMEGTPTRRSRGSEDHPMGEVALGGARKGATAIATANLLCFSKSSTPNATARVCKFDFVVADTARFCSLLNYPSQDSMMPRHPHSCLTSQSRDPCHSRS